MAMMFMQKDRACLERVRNQLLGEELAYLKRCKTNDERWTGWRASWIRRAMKLEYTVVVPSELSAGLRGFTDEVTVEIKDGCPDWETTQEMTAHFRQAIAEWYDGGRVYTKTEFDEQQALIDRQMEGHP